MVGRIDARERVAPRRLEAEAFHALADAGDRCVFFKDTAGRYVLVNSAFCMWLGRTTAEIVGHSVHDLWPRAVAEALDADDRRVLAGERIEKEEQRPNICELRTLRTVKVPLTDARGQIAGILGHFSDVTNDRHHSEDYHQSLRRAVVGRLTGGLSHDLNRLLTLAQLNASWLESGVPGDVPAGALTDRVETAVSYAAESAQRLIVFAPTDEPSVESCAPNSALDEVTNLFRAVVDRRIELDVSLGAGLPHVRVSEDQLTQVVLNLCLNARDSLPEGGRLKVQTDLVRVAAPRATGTRNGSCNCRRADLHVRLRVSDLGKGSTPEIRARTNDSWYMTKTAGKGCGLGLTIVQDVVRRHGGWIECISSGDRGTCFAVYLPPADVETCTGAAVVEGAALAPATILLVDNDASILCLCRTLLERNGYRVLTAATGQEAAELYRRDRGRIGVVVLDQYMPQMSGLAVLSELVAANPQVRVLLMSGAPREDIPPALDGNLRGFVTKPFRNFDFLEAVRMALASN